MNLYNQLERAFRKLKGSVYLDKTQAILRDELVKFEKSYNSNNVSTCLTELKEALTEHRNKDTWRKLRKKILDSISVLSFPKEVVWEDDCEKSEEKHHKIHVISNRKINKIQVKKENYFIDMCPEGHILGVLWILEVGVKLDEALLDTCYGNRLYDNLSKEHEDHTTSSPNLMKPYFQQYESWRDEGLAMAEDFLKNKKKNVVITMLDLTRYYYNVRLSKEKFRDMTEEIIDDMDMTTDDYKTIQKLNDLVFDIIMKYTNLIFPERKDACLPVGFLPSCILANYYLKEFDEKVINSLNPLYYGRYVDDIIIIEQLDKKSDIMKKYHEINQIQVLAEMYLKRLCKKKIIMKKEEQTEKVCLNSEKEPQIKYMIHGFPNLIVQENKFKFFYLEHDGTAGVLEKIRKEIEENTSEFNFMPIENGTFDKDYTRLFTIDRSDSVNKIRGIERIDIGKYELSKTIAKHMTISKFIDDDLEKSFVGEINKIFDAKTILENVNVWENLITYYIVNSHFDELKHYIENIFSAIEDIVVIEPIVKEGFHKVKNISETLTEHLYVNLCRGFSLVWGENVKKGIIKFMDFFDICKKKPRESWENYRERKYAIMLDARKSYCRTGMTNKYLLPITINEWLSSFDCDDINKVELFSITSYLNQDIHKKEQMGTYNYKPYIDSPFDIAFTNLLRNIRCGKNVAEFDDHCVTNVINERYAYNFMDWERNMNSLIEGMKKFVCAEKICIGNSENQCSIVKVKGTEDKKKLKIAISNVRLHEQNCKNVLIDDRKSSYQRYDEVAELVNQAIRYQSDILIMPESYVPIEYIPLLQKQVVKHNMIIVTGVEHIKFKDTVYNLTATLLPLITDDLHYTIPYFHNKVHFSPSEKGMIEDYGLHPFPGNEYTLFCCKGLYFVPYTCFELASIKDRAIFQTFADLIIGVEWNRDTKYFANIMESLSRDMHCYCAQVNNSTYGDSRVMQPTKSDAANIIQVKGGLNGSILVGEIDLEALRDFQMKGYWGQEHDKRFKFTPPDFEKQILKEKKKGTLYEFMIKEYSGGK